MVRYTFNKRTTHCCRRNISSRVLLIFFSRASIKRCVKWIWNSRRRGKRDGMREQNIQILDPVTNVWFGLHSSAPYGARDKFPTILYRLPFSRGQYWMTCLKSCLSCRPNPLWSNLCGNSGEIFLIRRKPSANSRPYFLLLLLLLLTTQFVFSFLCYLQFPRSFFFPQVPLGSLRFP